MAAGRAEWGSDVVVEMMQAYGMEYAMVNLGGTFRGVLDSIVNFGENQHPQVIECLHEEIAVAVAIGYSKVTGKPSVALVHNVVGTLHASMNIYDAYVSQTPVIIMSGTGPMSQPLRRPWIDWVHTALVQGNLVRDYVKWDDQPHDAASFPESFIRAVRVATTEPQGPVYIALDAGWQEVHLEAPIEIPDLSRLEAPTRLQGDPVALRRTAELLANAQNPVLVAGNVSRKPEAVQSLVELAEVGNFPVMDLGGGLNFPNTHRLDATGTNLLSQADVLVLLDLGQADRTLTIPSRYPRGPKESRLKPGAQVVNISLQEQFIRSTMLSYGRLYPVDLNIGADTSVAIPELTQLVRAQLGAQPNQAEVLSQRAQWVEAARATVRKRWEEEYAGKENSRPISHARLAQETWNVIKDDKWFLSGDADGWLRRLWKMDRLGSLVDGGGAAGLGIGLPRSVGIGLAAKEQGGFCVAYDGDGDFLYVPTSIWTAVHHHIPVLLFVLDNGGYMGEGGHVSWTAEQRDRSTANSHVAVHIDNPRINFAGLAREQGAYAEGPIEDPNELGPAIQRAYDAMKKDSTMAVVQVRVVNQHVS